MRTSSTLPTLLIAVGLGLGIPSPLRAGQSDLEQIHRSVRAELQLMVELASDAAPEDLKARNEALDLIADETIAAEIERLLAQDLFDAPPVAEFTSVTAAQGDRPFYYMRAARQSYAKFRGAEEAGDREWMARHLTSARAYAALAAQGLVTAATADDGHITNLGAQRFAARRSLERATAFLEDLKRNGLSAEHRKLAMESGYDEAELEAYVKVLQATPPGELGVSMVELLSDIPPFRQDLSAWLDEFAKVGPAMSGEPKVHTYVVGNPHDREETIDLFIQRASIPSEWKLSIVDAEPSSDGTPQKRVQEVVAGRHYRVQLPAKGQLQVASVVEPVGVVAENTTARWAVEGKIGNELLGGMVHEMHVPAMIVDLQLPPIVPADSAAGLSTSRSPLVWLAAASVMAVGILVTITVWRRKRLRA